MDIIHAALSVPIATIGLILLASIGIAACFIEALRPDYPRSERALRDEREQYARSIEALRRAADR